MPSPGWKVTSAVVSSVAGGVPALASALDRAIEKHDEWAAPISSSGLVRPAGSSARDAHVTSKPPSPDDSSSTRPEPSRREPCQTVVAERVVAKTDLASSGYGQRHRRASQTRRRTVTTLP